MGWITLSGPGASHSFRRGMVITDGERVQHVLKVNHSRNAVMIGAPRWPLRAWWATADFIAEAWWAVRCAWHQFWERS